MQNELAANRPTVYEIDYNTVELPTTDPPRRSNLHSGQTWSVLLIPKYNLRWADNLCTPADKISTQLPQRVGTETTPTQLIFI